MKNPKAYGGRMKMMKNLMGGKLFDQLTKEQQDLYRKIELEILELESINDDHLIELTYKVCKELFCKN